MKKQWNAKKLAISQEKDSSKKNIKKRIEISKQNKDKKIVSPHAITNFVYGLQGWIHNKDLVRSRKELARQKASVTKSELKTLMKLVAGEDFSDDLTELDFARALKINPEVNAIKDEDMEQARKVFNKLQEKMSAKWLDQQTIETIALLAQKPQLLAEVLATQQSADSLTKKEYETARRIINETMDVSKAEVRNIENLRKKNPELLGEKKPLIIRLFVDLARKIKLENKLAAVEGDRVPLKEIADLFDYRTMARMNMTPMVSAPELMTKVQHETTLDPKSEEVRSAARTAARKTVYNRLGEDEKERLNEEYKGNMDAIYEHLPVLEQDLAREAYRLAYEFPSDVLHLVSGKLDLSVDEIEEKMALASQLGDYSIGLQAIINAENTDLEKLAQEYTQYKETDPNKITRAEQYLEYLVKKQIFTEPFSSSPTSIKTVLNSLNKKEINTRVQKLAKEPKLQTKEGTLSVETQKGRDLLADIVKLQKVVEESPEIAQSIGSFAKIVIRSDDKKSLPYIDEETNTVYISPKYMDKKGGVQFALNFVASINKEDPVSYRAAKLALAVNESKSVEIPAIRKLASALDQNTEGLDTETAKQAIELITRNQDTTSLPVDTLEETKAAFEFLKDNREELRVASLKPSTDLSTKPETSGKSTPLPQSPSLPGRTIDKPQQEKWINAHPTEQLKSIARVIAAEIERLSIPRSELKNALAKTVQDFKDKMAKPFMIFELMPDKSNSVMLELARQQGLPDSARAIGTVRLERLLKANPQIKDVVIIDNAVYSGEQMIESIDILRAKGVTVHVVAPYMTEGSAEKISSIEGVKIYQHETLASIGEMIAQSGLDAETQKLFEKIYRLDSQEKKTKSLASFEGFSLPDGVSTLSAGEVTVFEGAVVNEVGLLAAQHKYISDVSEQPIERVEVAEQDEKREESQQINIEDKAKKAETVLARASEDNAGFLERLRKMLGAADSVRTRQKGKIVPAKNLTAQKTKGRSPRKALIRNKKGSTNIFIAAILTWLLALSPMVGRMAANYFNVWPNQQAVQTEMTTGPPSVSFEEKEQITAPSPEIAAPVQTIQAPMAPVLPAAPAPAATTPIMAPATPIPVISVIGPLAKANTEAAFPNNKGFPDNKKADPLTTPPVVPGLPAPVANDLGGDAPGSGKTANGKGGSFVQYASAKQASDADILSGAPIKPDNKQTHRFNESEESTDNTSSSGLSPNPRGAAGLSRKPQAVVNGVNGTGLEVVKVARIVMYSFNSLGRKDLGLSGLYERKLDLEGVSEEVRENVAEVDVDAKANVVSSRSEEGTVKGSRKQKW